MHEEDSQFYHAMNTTSFSSMPIDLRGYDVINESLRFCNANVRIGPAASGKDKTTLSDLTMVVTGALGKHSFGLYMRKEDKEKVPEPHGTSAEITLEEALKRISDIEE